METGTESPTLAARLAGWDPAGLLYGAIVTAAVLVTAGGHSQSVGQVVAAWAVVLGTYFLAHVYVHAAESQFDGDQRHILHRSLVAAKAEVAVLEGGIPAILVFLIFAATDADVSAPPRPRCCSPSPCWLPSGTSARGTRAAAAPRPGSRPSGPACSAS